MFTPVYDVVANWVVFYKVLTDLLILPVCPTYHCYAACNIIPDGKVHEAGMGTIWGR